MQPSTAATVSNEGSRTQEGETSAQTKQAQDDAERQKKSSESGTASNEDQAARPADQAGPKAGGNVATARRPDNDRLALVSGLDPLRFGEVDRSELQRVVAFELAALQREEQRTAAAGAIRVEMDRALSITEPQGRWDAGLFDSVDMRIAQVHEQFQDDARRLAKEPFDVKLEIVRDSKALGESGDPQITREYAARLSQVLKLLSDPLVTADDALFKEIREIYEDLRKVAEATFLDQSVQSNQELLRPARRIAA